MSLFKIKIQAGKPAKFVPTSLQADAGDSVFWSNEDTVAHWPAPSVTNKTAWLDYQVPPGGVSSQISLNPPAPYTLNYVCVLHPGETGQIKVGGGKKAALAAKTKSGAYGGKTKGGAYGGKTKQGAYGSTTQKGSLGGTKK